jgi:hypothetical protein
MRVLILGGTLFIGRRIDGEHDGLRRARCSTWAT